MCVTPKLQREYSIQQAAKSGRKSLSGRQTKVRRLFKKQNKKCYWCGVHMHLWWQVDPEFYEAHVSDTATIEHLKPRKKGGEDREANMAAACFSCNSLRGVIPHNYFKWVSANQLRFEKYKALRKVKARVSSEVRQLRNRTFILNVALISNFMNYYKR